MGRVVLSLKSLGNICLAIIGAWISYYYHLLDTRRSSKYSLRSHTERVLEALAHRRLLHALRQVRQQLVCERSARIAVPLAAAFLRR